MSILKFKGRQASVTHEDVDRLSDKVLQLIDHSKKERARWIEVLGLALQCIEASQDYRIGNPTFEQAASAIHRIIKKH